MVQLFLTLFEVMVILCLSSSSPLSAFSNKTEVVSTHVPDVVQDYRLLNLTTTASTHQCPLGCITCSTWNGCVDCAQNFTWHVEKVNMRKIGVCLRQCPSGYFTREFHHLPGHFRCVECKAANCAVCGERDFCDKCQEPFLEYRGACILRCPENLYHSKYRKDCFEQVDCLVSVWSEWSECQRNGQTCGYKWGNQTRIRSILQEPSPNGFPCPSTIDNQRCLLKQRYCELENTAAFFSLLSRQRHERRQEKRKRRCRLRKRAGRPCKNHPDNVIRVEPELSHSAQETRSDPMQSAQNSNSSSYYDYYKQSAELLKLLNLRKDSKSRKSKKKSRKN